MAYLEHFLEFFRLNDSSFLMNEVIIVLAQPDKRRSTSRSRDGSGAQLRENITVFANIWLLTRLSNRSIFLQHISLMKANMQNVNFFLSYLYFFDINNPDRSILMVESIAGNILHPQNQNILSEKQLQEIGKHIHGRQLPYHDAETTVQIEFEGLIQFMRTQAQEENRESLLQFSRLHPTKFQQYVNSIKLLIHEKIKSMSVPKTENFILLLKQKTNHYQVIDSLFFHESVKQYRKKESKLKNAEEISKNGRKSQQNQANNSTIIITSQNHQYIMKIKDELFNDFQNKIRSFSADIFHANSNGAGDSLSVALHQIDRNRRQYVSNFCQMAKMRLMNDTALTQQLLSEIVGYMYVELNKQYALFRRNWGLSQLSNFLSLLILNSYCFVIFRTLKQIREQPKQSTKNRMESSSLKRFSGDKEEIIRYYITIGISILGFFIRQSVFSLSHNYQQWISHYQNCTLHTIATASNPISEKDPKRVEFSPLPSRQRIIMRQFEAKSKQYMARCQEAKRRLLCRKNLGLETTVLDFVIITEIIRNIQLLQTQLRSLRNNRIETADEADLRSFFDIGERIFQNIDTIISRTRSNLENSELGQTNDQTRTHSYHSETNSWQVSVRAQDRNQQLAIISIHQNRASVRIQESSSIHLTRQSDRHQASLDTSLARQFYRLPDYYVIQINEKLLKEYSSVLRSVNSRGQQPEQSRLQLNQPINQQNLMMETYQNVGAIYAIWKGKNGQNQRATSTAFLISANQLVTCSHAIYSLESEQFCDEYFFIPGCRESDKIKVEVFPFERQKVKSTIDTVPRDQRHRNEEFEFSVITLPKPVYLRQYLEITAANDVKLSSDSEIALIGYGKPVLIYEEKTGIVNIQKAPRLLFHGKIGELIETGSILHHRFPTQYGMSGSPIFAKDSYQVIGIHTAGSKEINGLNSGLYFSRQIFKTIEKMVTITPNTQNTVPSDCAY